MSDTERLARVEAGSSSMAMDPEAAAATAEASTDTISGAASHAHLRRELAREHARCRRYEHSLAVIACDVDRLQLINSGFGRDAGDEVLRALCARATRSLRSSDWIGRKSEDEFVIVLPETDLAGAAIVAERIRGAMSDRPISWRTGSFPVTVSVGYSAVDRPRELGRFGPEDLLATAEEQLALAVRSGRNRVCGAMPQRLRGALPVQEGPRLTLTRVPAPQHLSLMDYQAPSRQPSRKTSR